MPKFWLSLSLLIGCYSIGFSQNDSLKTQRLKETVVTATRTEKLLSSVPIPIAVIGKVQIQQMGSSRLNEVLQEQTGLTIVTDHGQGIQMQGLNPDYTLILIDGEPLIGRTAGTLELSRLAVGNIKQIEIVKGASSSLYGSEALAGTINIITDRSNKTYAKIALRAGTSDMTDASAMFNLNQKRFGMYFFANRYNTDGYSFAPENFAQGSGKLQNYTFHNKLYYEFSDALKLSLSTRYFLEYQDANIDSSSLNPQKVYGKATIQDFNINPVLAWQISSTWKTQIRLYHSKYNNESNFAYLKDQTEEKSNFEQTFLRPEIQTEFSPNDKHTLTFGGSKIWERLEATRYTSIKRFSTVYGFLQYEFMPSYHWDIIVGGRFDSHSIYGEQLSPKLSAQYRFSEKIAVRASVGTGFKAPDFRQLYLHFRNPISNYSVFGTEELPLFLAQNESSISKYSLSPSLFGNLKAEKSVSYNCGIKFNPLEYWSGSIDIFRNDVKNLIENQELATMISGEKISSYRNIKRIYTQGIEINSKYIFNEMISLSGGYQYLEAKDKDVLNQLDAGTIYARNPKTYVTKKLSRSDYGGLMNRSRHSFNMKVFYNNEKTGFSANLRCTYQGKYGKQDNNGNTILDDESEYVKGYAIWNATISKMFWNQKITLQAGCENILDHQDANISNLRGRELWLGLSFQLDKK